METDSKETQISFLPDLDWQVGSKTPPKVCLCCGFVFDDIKRKIMGPYYDSPYIWICTDCHSKDFLHSPDKHYSKVDLKSVLVDMKKSLDSTRNEEITYTKISHTLPEKAEEILPGLANSEGKKINIPLKYVPLAKLKLDSNNLRFRHVGINLTDSQMEEMIWTDPDTAKLFRDLKNTLGIIEPLYTDSDNIVLEGNRRLVCLRKLAREIRGDVIRNIPLKCIDPVPCRVITNEIDLSLKDEFLARIHIAGKKQWRPLDQAAHLHELYNVHGKSVELLSEMTSLTPKLISVSIRAYELTSEYHRLYPKDTEWVSKYSYFLELVRKPSLEEWIENKKNILLIMEWIANKQIERGEEIRKIHYVIQNKIMLKNMMKGKKISEVLHPINRSSKEEKTLLTSREIKQKEEKKREESPTLDKFFEIANGTIMKSHNLILQKKDIRRLKELMKALDDLLTKKK